MTSLDARLVSGFELLRIAGGFRRILKTELGQEQLCARCNEPWPMDPEFFRISNGCVSYECKACIQEHKQR
ncbi:MAG: hypothetical protein K2X55_30095 [Burkholderiaceae bacterium]|nr:hypothetical protein [Burkholderiaceae bacterium]